MYLPALFNMQGSDEHCKSFKWLDGIPCRHGPKTAPIVIVKFTRLKAEATMAKNKETEARAMVANLLHRERVAKRSAEKARVSFIWPMCEHINIKLLYLSHGWHLWCCLYFHLVIGRLDYGKCVCHDFEFGLVVCIIKFYYVVGHGNVLQALGVASSVGVGPGNICVE